MPRAKKKTDPVKEALAQAAPVWRLAKIAELHQDPTNARKHGDRNREVVRASLETFGQVENLVVERGTGKVLGGNCRLDELIALGRDEVMIAEVDVHGPAATKLALVLNRSAELAEWDPVGLADVVRELQGSFDGLADIGWDPKELEKIVGRQEAPIVTGNAPVTDLEQRFDIVVECGDYKEQEALLARLLTEGVKCRPIM
jgi:ParB-like chromosome segregation protein Spo0J